MTFELKIDENDYLTYQLFVASKSESIKKKRNRNKIIMPILYLALGAFVFYQNNLRYLGISCTGSSRYISYYLAGQFLSALYHAGYEYLREKIQLTQRMAW
jgi:hypothetical protein